MSKNRYPGGRSFMEEDFPLFFGRQNDVQAFLELLSVRQMVVLMGKSGSGKSSLINAGIVPQLLDDDCNYYFIIRFNNFVSKSPPLHTHQEETGVRNADTADKNQLSPVSVVIKRLSILDQTELDTELSDLIPDKTSFWYWIKQHQAAARKKGKPKLFLFFEQFEELFTYPKDQVQGFTEELYQLLYSSVPNDFRDIIYEAEHENRISEELEDLLLDKPNIRVVFSVRSDRLSQMNVMRDLHPTIFQNCYPLEELKIADAELAITQPARLSMPAFKGAPFRFEKDAINHIIKSICHETEDRIDAASLQIVCRFVEEHIVGDKADFTVKVDDLGDMTDIFKKYYENILNRFEGDERQGIQKFIEDDMIDDDRRNAFPVGFITKRLKIKEEALDLLEQSSLLRKERDASGRLMYEIGHDRIMLGVVKVAEQRKRLKSEENQQKTEQINRKLKEKLFGYRLFTASMVLLIVCLVAVFFLWRKLAVTEADLKTQQILASYKLEQVNKENALKAAWSYINLGIGYERASGSEATQKALKMYQNAIDTLKRYPDDPVYKIAISKRDFLEKKDKPSQ
ncbi:ATP-binding protein [Mucilaginibacter celer]|nr:ATP-binding protein [Mucilaginibacter celer]